MDVSNVTETTQDLSALVVEPGNQIPSDAGCPTINRTATSTKSSPPAGLQTSFTSDLYNRNQTDLEASKGCEARWLQLFHLVERQCQDQIVAQQEQFTHQIQLIRDEIKHLIQLQGSWSQWNSCTEDRVLNMASSLHPIRSGQNPGDTEKRESISSSFSQSNELDLQKKAFITQEHFLENTSVSSGYGTHSASEPNTCLSSCSQTTSRESRLPAVETLKECKTEPQRIHHVMQCSDKQCKLPIHEKSSEDIIFPSEHTEYVNTSSKSNSERSSKSLTTWALKCKRGHRKKLPQIDKASVNSSEENSQSDREAMDQSGKTDGSSQAFYLNQRAESANSIISAGSGFTYWMMDEKEMYHPLPESFGGTKLGKSGFTEPEEPRIPSLTDVYQQKQREGVRYPDWKPLSPAEYTHPPEVLTLDPTLHRKPYHDPGFSPHSYTDNCRVALTPDSILENTSYSHYKEEIGSSATSASSLLGESPNSYPNSPMVASEELKINRYQNRENMDYQRCPGDATFDRKAYCTDDEFNSLTSSVAQSPVPVTEENMHEFSSVLSLDHPLMLSNIRQNLREKHARHIADLRDYYESEISSLKQQLLINNKSSAAEDLKKIKSLSERYDHMEGALTEASTRIRLLENKNQELEMQVAEWKERHQTADNTSKALQEQIEEIRARGKEKENSISRLQSRLKEVEEAFEKAFKLSDDKDGRLKQEHKIFQDLLSEYESLGNEHERVKDTLSITENKLRDAHIEINQLKRSVSKLEAQIKQLEHENMVKLRHIAEGQLWQSCANSERANRVDNLHVMDVAKRKCLTPTAACSIFTGQPLDNKQSENENTQTAQYEPKRYNSPPEKEASYDSLKQRAKRKDSASQESPILKALRDFEEEKELKRWSTRAEKGNVISRQTSRKQIVEFSDCWRPHESVETNRECQRQLNSPSGPRSSSLPPRNRKPDTVTTPTKRELMLAPVSVKYSPKRSPRENFSPGLTQLLSSDDSPMTRFDVVWDDSSSHKESSPRKRLQFTSLEDKDVMEKIVINPQTSTESSSKPQRPVLLPPYETEFTYKDRMRNIADTERLFDDLIQEKRQIEAALSRMPGSAGRLNLQLRVKKENLEDRLEKINRELGSVRMTLKKFHILPTSANI